MAVALIVAALALRIALANYPFWFDEYASLIFADQPLSHLWGPWMVRETNPPLFYTLAKGWRLLAGYSIVGLRLLPILGSGCAMALLAVAARQAFGNRAVVPVLVLAGLSASGIFISHQFRGYIFCEVGVLIALIGLINILTDQGTARRNHALYIAGSTLAIYSHTSLLLWPVIATLTMIGWHALFRRDRLIPMAARLIGANLILLALSGWILWIAIQQLQAGAANIQWIKPRDLSSFSLLITQNTFLAFYPSMGFLTPDGPRIAKRVLELALVLASIRTLRVPSSQFFMAMFAVGAVVIWTVQLIQPVASDRTIHWLSLFPTLIIAGGIGTIGPRALRWLALGLPAGALALNLAFYQKRLKVQDFNTPLSRIAPDRSIILTEHSAGSVVFLQSCKVYYHRDDCPLTIVALQSAKPADAWAHGLFPGSLVTHDALPAALASGRAIYVVRHGPHDPLVSLGRISKDRAHRGDIEGPFTADQILGREPIPATF